MTTLNRPLPQAVLTRKAKAPTSPKVGALPFSLSSHKENRWTHTKPDPET
jgi:hypothetical protein